MAIVPVRNIGSKGVNTDIDSLALTPETFSYASNVRFNNGVISRGPMFKTVGPLTVNQFPKYTISYLKEASQGTPTVFICNTDGSIYTWRAGVGYLSSTQTNVSIAAYSPATDTNQFTHAIINGLVYVNRLDRVPWYIPADNVATQFAVLPNWDSTWRCQALRSFGGALVAMNITKGADLYPQMVLTSNFMTYGTYPDSWVPLTTNSATENVLSTLQEPLVDGGQLRDKFILYSQNNTWAMDTTGDNEVFSYRPIFLDAGAISQNCYVEHQNFHYVFGADDIWKHDGFNKKSLATDRVQDFIYSTAVLEQSHQFFCAHNVRQSDIYFCYVSKDPYVAFPVDTQAIAFPGCNRAAVYNYDHDTWSFQDLPYVTHIGPGFTSVPKLYSDYLSTPYSSMLSTSYISLTANLRIPRIAVSPNAGPVVAGVRSFEIYGSPYSEGSVDTNANASVFVENKYINLDQITSEIRGYKVVTAIYPNAKFFNETHEPLMFSFGSADYSDSPEPVYGTPMTFDGSANYKLDYVTYGRFLSIKITYADHKPFTLTGFDLDIDTTGHR